MCSPERKNLEKKLTCRNWDVSGSRKLLSEVRGETLVTLEPPEKCREKAVFFAVPVMVLFEVQW